LAGKLHLVTRNANIFCGKPFPRVDRFFTFASACGSANGKVERRRRDGGTQSERNDRRRAAGGSTPIIRHHAMPLVTSALFAKRNGRGREGNRADRQPVK
jgi:hypothetical protein